ncbi:transcriptional regulator [Rhizobium sp. RU36D]|uniref:transcriptional regulator n=1 Tax=Rhizobium sp. RU36D TaxID=1907415 RepID=UPI0009FD1DEA|nr:transcriptional regulator [Rhizobium sp. RU36D]
MTPRVHACLECESETQKTGDFCCDACRAVFNNRRKARGAEIYDLYMAHRFQRNLATQLKLMSRINRLASIYREEDRAMRNGRRSWRRPQDVLEERPYLRSIATRIRSGR